MTTVDLKAMTLKQLQETARAMDIPGRSGMSKEQLIETIQYSEAHERETDTDPVVQPEPEQAILAPVSVATREAHGPTQIQSLLLGIRESIASLETQLTTLEQVFGMRGIQMETETPAPPAPQPAPPEQPGPEPAGPQPTPPPAEPAE